jgi:hypothetical protein
VVKSLARTSTDQRESRCKTGYARAYASIALQEAHFRQLNVETRSRASQESNEAFGQRDFFERETVNFGVVSIDLGQKSLVFWRSITYGGTAVLSVRPGR